MTATFRITEHLRPSFCGVDPNDSSSRTCALALNEAQHRHGTASVGRSPVVTNEIVFPEKSKRDSSDLLGCFKRILVILRIRYRLLLQHYLIEMVLDRGDVL